MELPSQRVMETEGGHLPSAEAMQLSHREGSSIFLVVSAGKQQGWVGEWEPWEPAEPGEHLLRACLFGDT